MSSQHSFVSRSPMFSSGSSTAQSTRNSMPQKKSSSGSRSLTLSYIPSIPEDGPQTRWSDETEELLTDGADTALLIPEVEYKNVNKTSAFSAPNNERTANSMMIAALAANTQINVDRIKNPERHEEDALRRQLAAPTNDIRTTQLAPEENEEDEASNIPDVPPNTPESSLSDCEEEVNVQCTGVERVWMDLSLMREMVREGQSIGMNGRIFDVVGLKGEGATATVWKVRFVGSWEQGGQQHPEREQPGQFQSGASDQNTNPSMSTDSLFKKGADFALKCVVARNRREYETFSTEFNVLKQLKGHKNIIQLYDSLMLPDQCRIFLLLELASCDAEDFMHGRGGPGLPSVDQVRLRGPENLAAVEALEDSDSTPRAFSPREIRRFWGDMVHGVSEIHDIGYLHSDIKPANFLYVTEKSDLRAGRGPESVEQRHEGTIKLGDFGLSGGFGPDISHISRMHQRGTMYYMAPEAIHHLGEVSTTLKVKRAIDVWALGIILYQFIYLQHPYAQLLKQRTRALFWIMDPRVTVQFPSGRKVRRKATGEPSVFDALLDKAYLDYFGESPFDEAYLNHLKAIAEGCLQYDPEARWTTEKILNEISKDPWVDPTVILLHPKKAVADPYAPCVSIQDVKITPESISLIGQNAMKVDPPASLMSSTQMILVSHAEALHRFSSKELILTNGEPACEERQEDTGLTSVMYSMDGSTCRRLLDKAADPESTSSASEVNLPAGKSSHQNESLPSTATGKSASPTNVIPQSERHVNCVPLLGDASTVITDDKRPAPLSKILSSSILQTGADQETITTESSPASENKGSSLYSTTDTSQRRRSRITAHNDSCTRSEPDESATKEGANPSAPSLTHKRTSTMLTETDDQEERSDDFPARGNNTDCAWVTLCSFAAGAVIILINLVVFGLMCCSSSAFDEKDGVNDPRIVPLGQHQLNNASRSEDKYPWEQHIGVFDKKLYQPKYEIESQEAQALLMSDFAYHHYYAHENRNTVDSYDFFAWWLHKLSASSTPMHAVSSPQFLEKQQENQIEHRAKSSQDNFSVFAKDNIDEQSIENFWNMSHAKRAASFEHHQHAFMNLDSSEKESWRRSVAHRIDDRMEKIQFRDYEKAIRCSLRVPSYLAQFQEQSDSTFEEKNKNSSAYVWYGFQSKTRNNSADDMKSIWHSLKSRYGIPSSADDPPEECFRRIDDLGTTPSIYETHQLLSVVPKIFCVAHGSQQLFRFSFITNAWSKISDSILFECDQEVDLQPYTAPELLVRAKAQSELVNHERERQELKISKLAWRERTRLGFRLWRDELSRKAACLPESSIHSMCLWKQKFLELDPTTREDYELRAAKNADKSLREKIWPMINSNSTEDPRRFDHLRYKIIGVAHLRAVFHTLTQEMLANFYGFLIAEKDNSKPLDWPSVANFAGIKNPVLEPPPPGSCIFVPLDLPGPAHQGPSVFAIQPPTGCCHATDTENDGHCETCTDCFARRIAAGEVHRACMSELKVYINRGPCNPQGWERWYVSDVDLQSAKNFLTMPMLRKMKQEVDAFAEDNTES